MAARPDSNTVGRPTDYRDEFPDKIKRLMAEGLSYAASAAALGFYRQRFYEWEKHYPAMAEARLHGEALRQLYWEVENKSNAKSASGNATSIIWAMKNLKSDDWLDKQQVEHSGKDGGPIEFSWQK
jgi:hypothetical protein